MSRTIKFRAYVKFLHEIQSVDELYKSGGCMTDDYPYALAHDDVELMQFTGIVDAEGVDVYDGDLLRIPAKSDFEKKTYNCFEVFYHDNECIGGVNVGFCMNIMHSHGSSAGGQGYKFTPESIAKNGFVVIGNIHSNPELLK